MASTDRTFSFRAPAELDERVARARESLAEVVARAPEAEAWLARELEMALARRLHGTPDLARDRSAFLRGSVELLAEVTEKVAEGLALADEYAAARAEDEEADAFAEGALEASREMWRTG